MRRICFIEQLFWGLLIFGLSADTVIAQEYAPIYGIHTDHGLVGHFATIEKFVQYCSDRGYSSIMYMIASAFPDTINGYADYRFVSPTLDSLGWTFSGDDLPELMTAANNCNMDVFIDLQALAYVALDPGKYPSVSPPSADDVVNVVYELAAYGVTGISEEEFLAEWFAPVYLACQDNGLIYIHKGTPWDFGAMQCHWNYDIFEAYSNCDMIMTEDYEMTLDLPILPASEQFASVARWLGKEYQMKVYAVPWALGSLPNAENVALLKAVQLRPTYIYIMTWWENQIDLFANDMTALIEEHVPEEEIKPLCNVVLYLTSDEEPDIWDWWDFPFTLAAVSNGIKASGYDIITTDTPIDTADMYYIFTRGKWKYGTTLDLPISIVELFDSGKLVFLQLTHTLPNTTPNWNSVRSKLGIDYTTFTTVPNSDSVVYGTYKGIRYPHLRKGPAMWLNNISYENIVSTSEVLSTGVLQGDTFALIVRSGNNYFINGYYLDLRASFPISNLINDGLQKPTACVATAGNTSVFYALDITDGKLDTTELNIKLPDPLTTQVSWFKRDFDGVVSSGIASYDSIIGYIDTLSEGTLLILKSLITEVEETTDNRSSSANSILYQNNPNPFSKTTSIQYILLSKCRVRLEIYDLAGRLISTLVDKIQEPNSYNVLWSGKDMHGRRVVSGVYFYKLRAGKVVQTGKAIVFK